MIDVKGDLQCARDIDMLDRKLPSQEYLGAISVRREIGHIEADAVSLNDSMGLAGIEDHHRALGQGDSVAGRRKTQVQTFVFGQEEIAKGRAAILCAIMVVSGATAGHQGYLR